MVRLVPLNKNNWLEIANLKPANDQAEFIPSNLFSIAESKFEPCEGFGIYDGINPVGFLQICKFSGVYWISRIMIDARYQNQGLGKTALKEAINWIRQKIDATEIRVSVANQNIKAIELFKAQGFLPTINLDLETIYRLEL